MSLGQIKDCKIHTDEEEYVVTFHVVKMQSTRDSFPMLLGRPWLRMTKVVVDWGGPKPLITYGPDGNRSRMPIGPMVSLGDKSESSTSSEAEENDGEVTWERLVGHAQPSKGKATVASFHSFFGLGPYYATILNPLLKICGYHSVRFSCSPISTDYIYKETYVASTNLQ